MTRQSLHSVRREPGLCNPQRQCHPNLSSISTGACHETVLALTPREHHTRAREIQVLANCSQSYTGLLEVRGTSFKRGGGARPCGSGP